ncbi:glycoside hydrolase family 19 protein [Thioclava sp. GXIMD4216]|uniref:Glycoside hydrolase family 19 protein n=1 Tax=Thioclava litoralis TaxID=3076557 RepID=A0ABZ1DYC7_9RHOB|nr:glycoside hydrolase family 19 protein [Thioclava sp. FTW29]
MLSTAHLAAIAGRRETPLMRSVVAGLADPRARDMAPPHRLAQFVAQIAHESARFRYAAEAWGPTRAQRRYEGRRDLGNLQAGDGYRFRGRGPIQITGRANYARFTAWAEGPDFEAVPDAVMGDPWLGLSAVWFWQAGAGRSLNAYADKGDIEMITRRINGGLNGYADRLALYTRAGLVLLGQGPNDVRAFQRLAGLTVDGLAGPATRGALHSHLLKL